MISVSYLKSFFRRKKIIQPTTPLTEDYIRRTAIDYIRSHNTMSLATCDNNIPWAASVFYASSGFILYFISNSVRCLHCKNIGSNSKVALTINDDYRLKNFDDWRNIKGIQMEAEVFLLEDNLEIEDAVKIYTKKYPFTSIYLKTLFKRPKLSIMEKILLMLRLVPRFSASEDNRIYKVIPKTVWLVDNRMSFETRLQVPIS